MTPRRASDLFAPALRSTEAPTTTNAENYPAWDRPLKERYLQTLLSNTFGQAFYADAREMMQESVSVHDAMLRESPAFAAKALVYARNRGYMRTQPVYGLVRLFGVDRSLAKGIFDKIILTPNDLADFTAILKSLRKGEGGRAVKGTAGDWLLKHLSEYWVIKYGAEKGEGSYSLKDMLQVYHPNAHGKKLPLLDYIMGGLERMAKSGVDNEMLQQVRWAEALKVAGNDLAKIEAIRMGRLPHEVATSAAGSSKEVWKAIVPNMPIFALLRNLATLERHGVANEMRSLIEETFANKGIIQKSKILPFRFVEASKHVTLPWLADALRGALDLACDNVPDIPGVTDVALDVSGSMAQYIQTAAIFGICVARKTKLSGHLVGFNTGLFMHKTSMRDSILSQAEKIHADGGTNHSLVPSWLIKENRKIDNLVYITDEQQNQGSPLVDMIDHYRKRVNRDLKLFIMDVGPYSKSGTLVPSTDKNTWYIYGWSDQALSFISMAARGFGSMVGAIESGEEPLVKPD